MKKRTLLTHVLIIAVSWTILLVGCKSDRIDPNKQNQQENPVDNNDPDDSSVNTSDPEFSIGKINEVKENLQTASSTISVSNSNDLPIETEQGTAIYAYDYLFEDLNGNPVSYPIDITIDEAYTPRDMILKNMPTVSNGKLLVSGGEFEIRASKDGQELRLKEWSALKINVPADNPDPQMELFVGNRPSDDVFNWEPVTSGIDTISNYFLGVLNDNYNLSISDLGYINCDYYANYDPNTLTTVSFANVLDPNNEFTYNNIYIPEINSLVSAFDGKTGNVPIGTKAKAFCMAVDSKGEIFAYQEDFTITENHIIVVELEPVSLEELEALLNEL